LKLKVFGEIISPSTRANSQQRVDLQWTWRLCSLWSSAIFTSLICVLLSKPGTCWSHHSRGHVVVKSSPHKDEWLSWWSNTAILLRWVDCQYFACSHFGYCVMWGTQTTSLSIPHTPQTRT
jgi:hypothetical protein